MNHRIYTYKAWYIMYLIDKGYDNAVNISENTAYIVLKLSADLRFKQPLKVSSPLIMTDGGISTDASEEKFLNVSFLIFATLFGTLIDIKDLQFLNAHHLISSIMVEYYHILYIHYIFKIKL